MIITNVVGQICFSVATTDVPDGNVAIHKGAAGVAGSPLILGPMTVAGRIPVTCRPVAPELLADIKAHPNAYYITVGNTVRAQLGQ